VVIKGGTHVPKGSDPFEEEGGGGDIEKHLHERSIAKPPHIQGTAMIGKAPRTGDKGGTENGSCLGNKYHSQE